MQSRYGHINDWVKLSGDRLQKLIRFFLSTIIRRYFGVKTVGVQNIPQKGGFVLVSNHSSYADPFVQMVDIPRNVRFMAKSQLFDMPIIGKVVRSGGGFPVQRGKGDQWSMELARTILRSNHPVVVYPEGTRIRDIDGLGKAKTGAMRMAIDVGVPIIPLATYGMRPETMPSRLKRILGIKKIVNVIGEPIQITDDLGSILEPTKLRDKVWHEMQNLYQQSYNFANQ